MTTVLIVEDSEPLGRLLEQTLQRAGHPSRWVATGADALAAAAAQRPDTVLVDMHLSDLDGAELVTVLREALPAARIVGVSGATPDPGIVGRFDAFLLKPVGLDTLLAVVTDQ